MSTLIRTDVTLEPAAWSDPIAWYAVGVSAMMQRPITDPASWWYFAAIHGQDIDANDPGMPGWQNIIAPPSINWGTFITNPPASNPVMWDQCQHGTWYFPPWHRGYLMAIEAQLRADIVAAGGSSTWALPYWNYWNSAGDLPIEFTQTTLPTTLASGAAFPAGLAGTANPLYVAMRYGQVDLSGITPDSLKDSTYTGLEGAGGFGGGTTPFSHFGGSTGDLENDPHNIVHGDVGGVEPAAPNYGGLMGDPVYASLDPIFYLHHAMIDGMWAYWNTETLNRVTNGNPTVASWLKPAFPNHPGMFLMPWAPAGAGVTWQYTPGNVTSLAALQVTLSNGTSVPYAYTYDFLAAPATAKFPFNQNWLSPAATTARPALLERDKAVTAMAAPVLRAVPHQAELLGASASSIPVTNAGAFVPVQLDSTVRSKTVASLRAAAASPAEGLLAASAPVASAAADRVILKVEGVTGTSGVSSLDVFLHGPGRAKRKIGTAGLFGLRQASTVDDRHGGNGLSFGFDITELVKEQDLARALGTDQLGVTVAPRRPIVGGQTINVGRISVQRLSP